MDTLLSLRQIAEREPWRTGACLPKNAMDPAWTPNVYLDTRCEGNIDFDEEGWWVCMRCGRIGPPGPLRHQPIQSPLAYFLQSAALYTATKADTTPTGQMVHETLFVMGAALRQAAVRSLREYANLLQSPR